MNNKNWQKEKQEQQEENKREENKEAEQEEEVEEIEDEEGGVGSTGTGKKTRSPNFQSQLNVFTDELHKSIGFQKSGNPECKKKIRFNLCPHCEIRTVVEKLEFDIAHEYVFPCICMERSKIRDMHRKTANVNVLQRILKDLIIKRTSYFDMLCVVDCYNYGKCKSKISWKSLSRSTWERNNQPKCDNIRITAVEKAFATIAITPWGDVELHVVGPQLVNCKPYSRLGVGLNMISKQNWKPGFLFMNGKHSRLKEELYLELRYPYQFEGKITIGWPKIINQNEYDVVLEVNSRGFSNAFSSSSSSSSMQQQFGNNVHFASSNVQIPTYLNTGNFGNNLTTYGVPIATNIFVNPLNHLINTSTLNDIIQTQQNFNNNNNIQFHNNGNYVNNINWLQNNYETSSIPSRNHALDTFENPFVESDTKSRNDEIRRDNLNFISLNDDDVDMWDIKQQQEFFEIPFACRSFSDVASDVLSQNNDKMEQKKNRKNKQ